MSVDDLHEAKPIGAVGFKVRGEQLYLLPQKAVWWPSEKTLFVADVHIGKAAGFRALGVPVPSGTTANTLQRLSDLTAQHQPAHLVVLGDLLHSAKVHETESLDSFLQWRLSQTDLRITLVRGNHDDKAGDPPAAADVHCVDEPFLIGPFAALHHPGEHPQAYCLAGHIHPCVKLNGKGRDALRLPCFHDNGKGMVLPAFGAFTGMHTLTVARGEKVFPVTPQAVFSLPGF